MKYLKRFNEDRMSNLPHVGDKIESSDKISIFQQDWFEKLLPDTIKIVSDPQIHRLKFDQSIERQSKKEITLYKNDCTIDSDLVQFNYWNNSVEKPGDELKDGEPDMVEFDIHFVKNDKGIKMLVDITYGDNMAIEFSLESPNKINIIHYTGIGSKYDSHTHFGFKDESIKDLVNFFNSFTHGIKISPKDLSFMDEHDDSYQHNVNNKDHYYTDDSDLMKWGNSMKESKLENDIKIDLAHLIDEDFIVHVENDVHITNDYIIRIWKPIDKNDDFYSYENSADFDWQSIEDEIIRAIGYISEHNEINYLYTIASKDQDGFGFKRTQWSIDQLIEGMINPGSIKCLLINITEHPQL